MVLSKVIKTALYGAAAMLPATGAFALTNAQLAALPQTAIVYVSGSTATDKALKALFANDTQVCAAGSFTEYDVTATKAYVLTCTGGPGMTGLVGTNFAFVKQVDGGSARGIHPVAAGTVVNAFPNLTSPAAFAASCTGTSCTLTSDGIVPNAGISDEDPTTWIGTGGVTSADATALTASPAVQVPFGVVVSKALRDRLQTLEGLTAGSDQLADVPSLSSAQLSTIFGGGVSDWNTVAISNPNTNAIGVVSSPAGNAPLHLCERGQTSGSEFAANIRFTGAGCLKGKGVPGLPGADNPSSTTDGEPWGPIRADTSDQRDEFAFAGSGTGDLLNCVAAGLSPNNGEAVHYAIGFASMDQVPGTASWRFIAVDGVAPTIWNIQKAQYDWIMQDTFNYTTASLGLNGGPGLHKSIVDGVRSNLSSLVGLTALNAASVNNVAPADASGGAADGGLVTVGNKAIVFPAGPSAAAGWPAAIRLNTAGKGPNSPIGKSIGGIVNNCNNAIVVDPS